MNRTCSVLKALFVLVAVLITWVSPANVIAQPRKPITWAERLEPGGPYTVGQQIVLTLQGRIQPGYHIYSIQPPPAPANLPTTFKLDKDAVGLKLLGLKEVGTPIQEYDKVFETQVNYFSGEATFQVVLQITAPQVKLRGYLSYQVCDTNSCIPGVKEVNLALQAGNTNASVTNSKESSGMLTTGDATPTQLTGEDTTLATGTNTVSSVNTTTTAPSSPTAKPMPAMVAKSNSAIFMEAFLAGLIALFTPCVYPMITLTVSFFTKRSPTRAIGIRNAFLYAFSIVFIYVVLGLLLTIIFGGDTLYRLASNPWVNLFFFAVLVLFSLSFLGWFEIELPSRWSTALDAKVDRGGLIGIFFMASTLVLVSFSCTGPLVGTLLINVAGGTYLAPTIGMLGFSTAFAIPFGLFAVFPTALKALPKSGGWLNAVKVTLGFLELALALKFLSNADLVWHLGILDREVYLGAWIVIFILLGMYFLGKLRLPHDTPGPDHVTVPNLLLALFSFWFVVYLVPGLWGAPLRPLSGLLPPVNEDIGVRLAGGSSFSQGGVTGGCTLPATRKYAAVLQKDTPPGYCVFYDLEEGIAYAKQVHKPIFLDFTGHTCTNCRHMEANVWPDAAVHKHLTEDYVMISLFVDDSTPLDSLETLPDGSRLRTVGDKWLRYEQDAFRVNAQPYYVLLHPQTRKELAPARAFNLDKKAYANFLAAGLAAYSASMAN